ncbi:MAG: nucleotidyltransferase family protein [Clostridia bacterium]|nr:nucleotidyltransferase family protein [Clostridia bacterium]
MKFCAVICEYNPFHNGHLYQLNKIREESGCDKILCVMSGNFTQRGEAALFSKYERAKHAVENGADVVLELPTAFAVAPAEIFAEGAISLISQIPAVTTLAFGCESGDKEQFLAAAKATLSESKEFKALMKENMKDGTSFVKARTDAALALNSDIDEAMLKNPNNILGVEYCRALLSKSSAIEPMPIPRVGGGYSDTSILADFSSATALRGALLLEKRPKKAFKRNLPKNVYDDIMKWQPNSFETATLTALLSAPAAQVAECTDCSEGLENRLQAMTRSNPEYHAMLKKAVSKRYTLSRLKRILCENLLNLKLKSVKEFLSSPLYLNVLAAEKTDGENILSELSQSALPLLVRKSDALALKKSALASFETDALANDLYNVLTGNSYHEYETLFVERPAKK